jgi:hypothetical protein
LHLAHPVRKVRLCWLLIPLLIPLLISLRISIALLRGKRTLAARTYLRVGTDSFSTIGAAYHEHPHFRTPTSGGVPRESSVHNTRATIQARRRSDDLV